MHILLRIIKSPSSFLTFSAYRKNLNSDEKYGDVIKLPLKDILHAEYKTHDAQFTWRFPALIKGEIYEALWFTTYFHSMFLSREIKLMMFMSCAGMQQVQSIALRIKFRSSF